MISKADIKTLKLEDLVGRTISIHSFREGHVEIICASDVKTGDFFVLKEINHPMEATDFDG